MTSLFPPILSPFLLIAQSDERARERNVRDNGEEEEDEGSSSSGDEGRRKKVGSKRGRMFHGGLEWTKEEDTLLKRSKA